jgi:hypothetical protein
VGGRGLMTHGYHGFQRVVYLKLKRLEKTLAYTMGALYVDEVFFCHTLELPVGANTPRKEAIPAGMYPVVLQAMPSRPDWGPLPLLLDVPDRSGIFAHIANKPEDILGCIGLGLERRPGGQLRRSGDAVKGLVAILSGCLATITIED